MSTPHIHIGQEDPFEDTCRECGAHICTDHHPGKTVCCTLTRGHDGPHTNEWYPENGTWENK